MTGLPGLNFPAFHAAANCLLLAGHEPVNPAEFDQGENPTWADCMRKDIPALMECDAILLLKGWALSRGALLELQIANAFGLTVYNTLADVPVAA